MKKKINVIINLKILIILFLVLISTILFPSRVMNYDLSKIVILIWSLFIASIWLLSYSLLKKINIEKITKSEKIILTVYFIVIIGIQIFFLSSVSVKPNWDFKAVYETANYHLGIGNVRIEDYAGYFTIYPNNIGLLLIIFNTIKFGLLANISPLVSCWILNILFINFAFVLLYIYIRKKYDVIHGLFSLNISLFFLPIFLYISIFYTDTLSLFIPIAFLLLYEYINTYIEKKKLNKKEKITFYSLWILMGILMTFGASIKVTVLFVVIAILVKIILSKFNFLYFKGIFIMIISFICGMSIFNSIVNVYDNKYSIYDDKYVAIPYTHWVMMGIEDKDITDRREILGFHNINDFNLTTSYKTKEEMMDFNQDIIKSRINKMGTTGYLTYLMKKSSCTWGDGYYHSDMLMKASPLNKKSWLYQSITKDNKYFFDYFVNGVQLLILFIFVLSSIIDIRKNKINFDIKKLSIVYLVIFLLFWENSSRYIFNYVFIFIIIAIEFLHNISNLIEEKQKGK